MRRILRPWLVLPVLALAAAVVVPAAAHAQRISAFSISGGALLYRLGENGAAPEVAVRAELPYSSLIMVELGVMVARPELETGEEWLILPQSLVQLRIPAGTGVEPYVGGGAGLAFGFEDITGSSVEVMLTGATGVRIDHGGLLGFVVDARAHAIGFDADAHMIELTLGVRFRR